MVTPYETYNGQIGVRLSFLVSDSDLMHDQSLRVISYEAYKWRAKKHKGFRLRMGLGKGNEVLIAWSYITSRESLWKDLLLKTFGSPERDRNPIEAHFAMNEAARSEYLKYVCADGSNLKPEEVTQCVVNVSVLESFLRLKAAREADHRRKGNSARGLWPGLIGDLVRFNDTLKGFYGGLQHTLPKSERRIRADITGYQRDGYEYFIDARKRNKSASIVREAEQAALIEQLLRAGVNYNNEEIAKLYNVVAEKKDWKTIGGPAVANYRKKLGFFITPGNQGRAAWEGKYSIQHKRSAPTASMAFWSMDGWQVELLYQKETIDKKGHKVTTYHNRLTAVVVLDPVAGIKYPVGYAIGTHETPALILEALRNAVNHTQELFGQRYKPLQLQSDRYAIKTLSPVYEQLSKHYTPAGVGNAKAKPVEPWWNVVKSYSKMYYPKNYSGSNVTARAENQPNDKWLDMHKKDYPDEAGCRKQIERIMEMIRDEHRAEYMERFEAMPEADRMPLSNMEYLLVFGQTHTHTNRLQGQGLCPTINGQALCFDSYDIRFRELGYMDWAIKYDPNNLDEILVLNAKADANRNVEEVIGSHCFVLEKKYIQPMAIYEQKPEDNKQLAKVSQLNKLMESKIIERMVGQQALMDAMGEDVAEINDTLFKHVITDSEGQHKSQKQKLSAKKPAELPEGEEYEIIDEPIKY